MEKMTGKQPSSSGSGSKSGSQKPAEPADPPSLETENALQPSDDKVDDILCLVEEGGVEFLNHLLTKAVPPGSETPDTVNIHEWTLWDILKMPSSS
jgi:hypothetical protein